MISSEKAKVRKIIYRNNFNDKENVFLCKSDALESLSNIFLMHKKLALVLKKWQTFVFMIDFEANHALNSVVQNLLSFNVFSFAFYVVFLSHSLCVQV